jgi:hypothetical protein
MPKGWFYEDLLEKLARSGLRLISQADPAYDAVALREPLRVVLGDNPFSESAGTLTCFPAPKDHLPTVRVVPVDRHVRCE